MSFLDKLKFLFVKEKDPELEAYAKKLDKQFQKDALKAKYENKLKKIKEVKSVSGFEAFGKSLMDAAEKHKNHDFMGGTESSKKSYGADLLK